MDKIFIVRQGGVYWKEIVGVFLTQEEAIGYASTQIKADGDSYHELVVTAHTVGDYVTFNGERYDQSACKTEERMYSTRLGE